jgi:hypothetical protein
MSTDITGFLFSLDLAFVINQPLGLTLTLGDYVKTLPGWDKISLENQLSVLLDAETADNNFILNNFNFPAIPIHVPTGQSLNVFTLDLANAEATGVPEPSTWFLLASGLVGWLGYGWRQRKKAA